jgi:hypothetical protein
MQNVDRDKGVNIMFSIIKKSFVFVFSCILSFSSCQALDEVVQLVNNPCYPKFSEHERFYVSNGSMVNFAARGFVGDVIRRMSAKNSVPNPLGLTHSGIAFLEKPSIVRDIIYDMTSDKTGKENNGLLDKGEGRAMMEKLQSYFGRGLESDKKHPFLLESNGTAGQVLKGIFPHVQISPLLDALDYDGNVYIRPFLMPVPSNFILNFAKEHVGRPYEKNPLELLKSVKALNTKEGVQSVFCSEFAAMFYRSVIGSFPSSRLLSRENMLGKFPEVVGNVIPEQFCFSLGEQHDVLYGIADREIPIKYITDFKEEEEEEEEEEAEEKGCFILCSATD